MNARHPFNYCSSQEARQRSEASELLVYKSSNIIDMIVKGGIHFKYKGFLEANTLLTKQTIKII